MKQRITAVATTPMLCSLMAVWVDFSSNRSSRSQQKNTIFRRENSFNQRAKKEFANSVFVVSRWALFYSTIIFFSSFSFAIPVPVRLQKRHIVVRTMSNNGANNFNRNNPLSPKFVDLDESNDEHLSKQISHEFAIKYLNEFGHLSTLSPSPRELRTAVESFQHMVGVKANGILNAKTIELMAQPRCGNIDVSRSVRERRKRFVYISRWENKMDSNNVMRLKWYLENYTSDIPRAEIKKIVERAFYLWSSQVKIQAVESLELGFEEASTEAEADITILWAEGDHGDSHKFDGPGQDGSNILAHTFYPNYQLKGSLNGDIHFDEYEQWNVDGSKEGASFPHVLVHEIGHTLGLGHSKKQQAIMFPIYRKEHLDLMQLDLDDKCAVNWSYIGASDLCLYIWLLSEVVPKKVAMEKERSFAPKFNDDRISFEKETSTTTRKELLIKRLQQTTIPTCQNDNRVRAHVENMLVRRLSFPRELAKDYSEVVCNFLAGLQRNYNIPATDNFHKTFRVDGTHHYFQGQDRFDALEAALNKERSFDSTFFDQILQKFIAGSEQ